LAVHAEDLVSLIRFEVSPRRFSVLWNRCVASFRAGGTLASLICLARPFGSCGLGGWRTPLFSARQYCSRSYLLSDSSMKSWSPLVDIHRQPISVKAGTLSVAYASLLPAGWFGCPLQP